MLSLADFNSRWNIVTPSRSENRLFTHDLQPPNVDNPAGGVSREIHDNVQSRTPYVGVAEDWQGLFDCILSL